MSTLNTVSNTTQSGFGLLKSFNLILTLFVFGIIFINAAIISIENKDINYGVKYLGYNFFYTTEKLNDECKTILDRGVIIPHSENKIKDIILSIKTFWKIFSNLFIIYSWLFLLANILLFFPIADNSKKFTAWMIAIILFILLQMVFIANLPNQSFTTPLESFKNLGKVIYLIFQPAATNAQQDINNLSDHLNNITII